MICLSMSAKTSDPVLDDTLAAFVQSGVAISVASRDASMNTSVTRGVACSVTADRRSVTVYVPVAPAGVLLDHVLASGTIAVCFSQPSTHRTIQLKGNDAQVVSPDANSAALVAAQSDALVANLARFGYAEELIRAIFPRSSEGVAAIRFTPSIGFAQTPGPQAGKPFER